MVSPQCKREAVEILTAERAMGVTRACGLVGSRARCIAITAADRRGWSLGSALRSSRRSSAVTATGGFRCCFVVKVGR